MLERATGGQPCSPLRVGLAGESTGPGGSEMVMLHLAEGLHRSGHDVRAFVPLKGGGWLRDSMEERGVPSTPYSVRSAVDPACVRWLAGSIREHRLDVLHSHDFTMAVYGTLAARLAGVRHVVTMHGVTYSLGAMRRRLSLRLAFASSHAVVAVSKSTADTYARRLRLPIDSIHVVSNGIPDLACDEAPLEWPLEQDGVPVMLALGNLRPVKGHLDLVDAAERLHASRPERAWRICIAGEGELRPQIEAEIERRNLRGRVFLLGFRGDVGNLLRRADLFVMPSHSEGHPISMLESLASGTPIVATRVGGIPEILGDGESGRLVSPHEPAELTRVLSELLDDHEERRRLGLAARSHYSEEFTVDRMVDDYLALYR